MSTEIEAPAEQFVDEIQKDTSGLETQDTSTTPPPKPVTQADMDAAFEKLGTTISKAVTPREQQEAKQMSPEEQKKLWAIYDPEEGQKDFMRKFFRLNPEATEQDIADARGMFKNMQEGLVRQSVVGAQNMTTLALEKFKKEYGFDEMRDAFRQMRAEKLQTDFFKAYPALGEINEATGTPKFMKAIHVAANELAKENFASQDAYFTALAERASEFVKGILPDFDLGAKTKTKSSTSTPSLPRTRVGGSGGTARGAEGGDGKATRGANGDDSSTLDWTAAT